MRAKRLHQRPSGLLANAEHAGRFIGDERPIAYLLQVDEPDAVGEGVHDAGADLQREARLAEPAHAEERQQSRAGEQLLHLGPLALAADERRELLRQVVGRRLQLAQRREVLVKLRVYDLEHGFRRRKALQAYAPEILQRYVGRQPIAQPLRHRLRDEHLSAMRRIHDPGRAVDGVAEVIVVAGLYGARMHAAAHAQREARRGGRIEQCDLDFNHGSEAIRRILERGVNAVAGRLDHAPAMAVHGVAQQRIVPADRLRHLFRLLFPLRRASFDVGEEKRQVRGFCHAGEHAPDLWATKHIVPGWGEAGQSEFSARAIHRSCEGRHRGDSGRPADGLGAASARRAHYPLRYMAVDGH